MYTYTLSGNDVLYNTIHNSMISTAPKSSGTPAQPLLATYTNGFSLTFAKLGTFCFIIFIAKHYENIRETSDPDI